MPNPLAADLDHVLLHTGDIWEEFRSQRLFITGGTGFFGCWLLESLLWANDAHKLDVSAVVLTRNAVAFARKAPHLANSPVLSVHEGDVRSFAFPAGQFSHVLHCATDASAQLNREQPGLMLSTIIDGTSRVLDFAASAGTQKLLITSSGAVYGKQPVEVSHIDESYGGAPDVTDPLSAYGEGKRVSELASVIASRQCGFDVKIARCFAFVGPYLPLDGTYAIGNFIGNALRGEPIRIKGDGTARRSYLYAADLAIWLWTILLRAPSGRAYNVGSERDYSIKDTAALVRDAIRPDLEIVVEQSAVPGAPAARYVPSAARAKSELGLSQLVDVQDAIKRTAAWHQRTGLGNG